MLLSKITSHGVELCQVVQSCKGDEGILVAMDMDEGNLDGQAAEEAMVGMEKVSMFG